MKNIIFFILLYSSCSFADEINCFKRVESDSLVIDFFSSSDNFDYVKKMATEKLKNKLPHYEKINRINNIIRHSTQVMFIQGKSGDYQLSKRFMDNFPNNGCVWDISFSTPEKIRNMCDDNGAAGYFFDFIKINGEVKLNSILELETLLPDGAFSCKAFERYINN